MKNEMFSTKYFLRKRIKYMLISVIIVGVFFVSYQLIYFKELNRVIIRNIINSTLRVNEDTVAKKSHSKFNDLQYSKLLQDKNNHTVSLRGTNDRDIYKYLPNAKGKFTCFPSKHEIEFTKINDNYCDCPLDGSDEPGTDACNNGVFYCKVGIPLNSVSIPSYKVNDGYCDCCDGSDEWAEITVTNKLDVSVQRRLRRYQPPCPNIC